MCVREIHVGAEVHVSMSQNWTDRKHKRTQTTYQEHEHNTHKPAKIHIPTTTPGACVLWVV